MTPSIEKSLDLDTVNVKGGSSASGPTSATRQESIIDSAGIAPLGSEGTTGKVAGSSTTQTGSAAGNSGPGVTKSTHVSTTHSTEVKPHSSTTSGSAPGPAGSRGASTVTTKKSSSSSQPAKSHKPSADDPIWKKLAVVGAIAAAGVALVAGVRRIKDKKEEEDEPETSLGKLKRKTRESAHDAKHSTGQAAEHIGDNVSDLGHKISHTAGDLKDQVVGAGEDVEHKAEHKAEQAKKEAEKAKQEAKERMEAETKRNEEKAKLDAAAEQQRMTYGQDKKGHPKKALEDTGDGFLNYKAWWPWAKKDL